MQGVIYSVCVFSLFLSGMVINRKLARFSFPISTDAKESFQIFNPLVHRVLSFGHLPVVVDSIWIRAVVDGDMSRYSEEKGHSEQFYSFKLLTELDPSFFTAYWVGANLLAIARDDPKGATEILEKGMNFLRDIYPTTSEEFRKKHWPSPWYIPYYLGYVYLFELKNIHKAAEVLKELGKYPNTPFLWASVAKMLEQPEGIYSLGINYINHLAVTAQTKEIAESYLKRKKDLVLARHLFILNREFDKFRKSSNPNRTVFEKFVKLKSISLSDPLGGQIFLSPQGKIDSTTPREKVLGLE
jgi:hypothetical protein